MELSTREVASIIWLIAFGFWCLSIPKVRTSALTLIRSLFQRTFIVFFSLLAAYQVAIVSLLWQLGLWNVSLLKDTLTWTVITATTMSARAITSSDKENIFCTMFRDALTVLVIFEFILNTYTFHLAIELVLIPIVAIFASVQVVARLPEQESAKRFVTTLLSLLGMCILGYAAYSAWIDRSNLITASNLRSIALTPLLTVAIVPFMYLALLYTQYELLFVRLNIGREKHRSVKRYAKWRLFKLGHLSVCRVRSLRNCFGLDLMRVQSKEDIDALLP